MGFDYPRPDNEDGFEQLCLRLYRKYWKNENLKLYAKRGERQDGVDIFDPLCIKPFRAVQCKHHESTKTLLPSEIKAEVEKAEKSHFKIEHYVIATTAKKSRNAQDTVFDLNQRIDKKFTVDIDFWEELCQYASELGPVMAELIIYGQNILAGAGIAALGGPAAFMASLSGKETGTGDDLYASIEILLNERRFEVARHELCKLPDESAARSLSPEAQYKLFRLRAKLDLETGEYDSASDLFLKAYTVAPELIQAKQNQVLAFSLRGDTEKAYAQAKQYIAEGVTTPVMVLRLIDNITRKEQLGDCAPYIEAHSESDEGINTALSHKYMGFGEFDKAYEAARRALKITSDSPHAHFVAALSIHNAATHGERDKRRERLLTALEHYDAAEAAARDQRYTNLLPEVFVNRAAAKMLLGNMAGATADYRAAVGVAVQPAIYAVRAISFFMQEGDFSSAKQLLDFLDHSTQEAQYLIMVMKYHTGNVADKRMLISEMIGLAEQEWDRAVECCFQCVQWSVELNDFELAKRCLPASFQRDHPFQAHTMLAWISTSANDLQAAKDETSKALDASIQSAHPQELRVLARILVKLGDDARAVGLLEQATRPGVFDDEMKAFISCAQRLDRHDLLLRICRELRAAGEQDDQLRKLELQLLNQYAPTEALHLANEFSQSSAIPWYFIAFKNMVAARLNQLHHLNLDPSALPTPAQLSPDESNLVLLPYVTAGKYTEALKFLYAQRRLNFEDEAAHGRYVMFLLRYGHHTEIREPSTTVCIDCAVKLEIHGNGQRWIIIEDEQPVASRGEFATGSQLGHLLIGRSVGDLFELPGNLVQPECATVREIQTKYVRAAQDTFENFTHQFPGTSVLQKVHVGNGENLDFSPLIENLRTWREYVETCIVAYREHPCSIYLFANRTGINEMEAIKSLASLPNGQVKCCQGLPGELDLALAEGIDSNSVVLCISAIVTLTLIDGWRYLDSSKSYFVSQLTSELIDSWILEAIEVRPDGGGVVTLDEANHLAFRETTEDGRASQIQELKTLREAVDRYCTSASSFAMAALEPDKRKHFTKLVGLHNVEAMMLAKSHGAVCWSDDIVLGFIAKTELIVPIIWTQAALRCFVNSNCLSLADFDLVTAKLVSWNYTAIVWNARTVIAAGVEANWEPQTWPLLQCLAVVAKVSLRAPERISIVIEFLQLLRRSNCPEKKQRAMIHAILDTVGDVQAVCQILEGIYVVFGVDIPSAEYFRLALLDWLTTF